MDDVRVRDTRAAEGPSLTVWPATPRSVHRARHALAAALAAWGLAELEDAASLVLSELMTNALRQAKVPQREIGTCVARLGAGEGDVVRIEVHDPSPAKPEVRASGPEDEGGRGLALVDALTGGRWGVADRPGPGKLVWAELGGDA
jgi:anti-sigma regulatory factor (Ser/Thr protein kinase)